MAAKFSSDFIRETCDFGQLCSSRTEFISRVENKAKVREGANSDEARALAQTLANALGLIDDDDLIEATDKTGTARPARSGVVATIEGLLWGLACLAAAITVLDMGSGLIQRVYGAAEIVKDCRTVGCVPD